MFGIGVPELLIIAVIVVLLFIPIHVTRLLRKHVPNKSWLGILLSFFFFPWGQLYLPRAAIYIIALIALAAVEVIVRESFLYSSLLSPLVMWYRFYIAGKSTVVTAPIP